MNMKVGDTLLVFWTDPALPHGFDKIPSGNCADLTSSNAVALHPVQAGPANYTWTASTGGTFWFACPVPGKSVDVMLVLLNLVALSFFHDGVMYQPLLSKLL